MDYYELIPGVYRIQAGVGPDGEIFGGLFLKDDPGIVIGASGNNQFVKNLSYLLDDLNFDKPIRVYFPAVTFNELHTAALLQRKFSDITFYVHVDIIDQFKNPEDKFAEARYFINDEHRKFFKKRLPNEIDNVLGYDTSASFETENTKILIIPFSGPHKGHSFIYSRNHKLLVAGLILGRTSDPRSYYIDLSGNYQDYMSALSFLEKAKSEVIYPIYDEPEFTKDLTFKAESVRSAMKDDKKNILNICSLKYKSLDQIYDEYKTYYAELNSTSPYDLINLHKVKIYIHLEQMLKDKVLLKKDGQYRLNK